MSLTEMKVKSPKNPTETIIDKTPNEPFISPLQHYINEYCEKCDYWKGKCRLDDTNGMFRMLLCIQLCPIEGIFSDPTKLIQKLQKELGGE